MNLLFLHLGLHLYVSVLVLKPSHENVLEEAIQPTDNVKPRGILKNSQNKEIVNATEEQIKSVSALKEHHNCRSINIKTFFANNKKVKRGQTVTVASPLKQLEMKNLRQRKTQNYAESSIESPNTSQCSTSCSETKKHVPVYLQQPLNDQSPKKTSDLYEFVPDTKKPKKKMSDADFIVRPSKRQRKPKWQTKVKKVLTNLGLDVNSENLEKDLSDLIKKVSEAEKKEPQDIAKSDTNTDAVKNCENTTYSLSQTVLQNSFPTTPVKDEHIGFLVTSPESTTSTRNSPKVTILSHQVLTPDRILNIRDNNSRRTLESPIVFPNQPNANSTMLHNPNINSTMTEHQNPWRPPSPIKRNRYFLSIKKNDLPSVDQDMIIDSKLVENLSVSKNATNTESEPIKKMFQPTITSFVNPNEEGKSIVNESNLFDADHYERIHLSCKTIPKKSGDKRQKSDGISNYFGFDSDDEASEIIEKQVKVAKKKGPCRVPVVMLVNIIKRVQDDDIFFIDPLQRFNKTGGSIAEKLVPDSDDEDSGVKADVDDLEDVPLFMDLKPEVCNFTCNDLYVIFYCYSMGFI